LVVATGANFDIGKIHILPPSQDALVQRTCETCERDDAELRRKAAGASPTTEVHPAVASVLREPGAPLEPGVRRFMEERFGRDFAHIRVHHSPLADEAAAGIHARAFTFGRDIVFADGAYRPDSESGRRLLAHELTHTLQQRPRNDVHAPQAKLTVGAADDRYEREADRVADAVMRGGATGTTTLARTEAHTVQRDEKSNKDALAATKAANLTPVGEMEKRWADIRAKATAKALAEWVKHGDAALALMRTHITTANAALDANDVEKYEAYKHAAEGDQLAYRFVSWHVVVHIKLDANRDTLKRLIASFDADDRAFTGRTAAEEATRTFYELAELFPGWAKERLKNIDTAQKLTIKIGDKPFQMTGTSGSSPKAQAYYREKIAECEQFDSAIGIMGGAINDFLDTAQEEGFEQAVDAVIEFYKVRGQLGPKGSKRKEKRKEKKKEEKKEEKKKEEKKEEKKKEEKKEESPEPQVPLIPVEDEKKRRKCAIPINLKEAGWKQLGSDLVFAYTYESSTGMLADLKDCEIWENVAYPGKNPYVWPNPPWDEAWSNPTVSRMAPGPQGKFVDRHRPPQWAKTLAEADVSASQYYFFACPCALGKLSVATPDGKTRPSFVIRRRVILNDGRITYRYVINKSGGNAQIDPIKP
jgi:hypothetical protein